MRVSRSVLTRWLLAVLVGAALCACRARAPRLGQCLFNADCADPYVCVSHACRAPCRSERDCLTGELCVRPSGLDVSVCAPPDRRPCTYDTDCPMPTICGMNRECGPRCRTDYDCTRYGPNVMCRVSDGECLVGGMPLSDAGSTDVSSADVPSTDSAPTDAGLTCTYSSGTTARAGAVPFGTPTPLAMHSATAMNQVELDDDDLLDTPVVGPSRMGPCVTAGVLVHRPAGSMSELVYVGVSAMGTTSPTVVVNPWPLRAPSSLFFESDCTPIAVALQGSTTYVEWRAAMPGASPWVATPVGMLSTMFPGLANATHIASHVARDGTMHVFARASQAGSTVLVHGRRAAMPRSMWTYQVAPWPVTVDPAFVYDWAADGAGALHAVFRNTTTPCDPCMVDLVRTTYDSSRRTWTPTVVARGLWGVMGHDELIMNAAMAVDPTDQIVVAAHFNRRAATGSVVSSEMRVYYPQAGGYCHESVAGMSDAFAGGDGMTFTGALPDVAVDDQRRVVVLFADQYFWHAAGMQNEVRGQWRVGVRTSAGWDVATLVRARGLVATTPLLEGHGSLSLALSANGADFVAFGAERVWQTDTIYNAMSRPVDYRALFLRGAVAPR